MGSTNKREQKLTRTVKVPIDLVWKVWTEPEYIGPNENTITIHKMELLQTQI